MTKEKLVDVTDQITGFPSNPQPPNELCRAYYHHGVLLALVSQVDSLSCESIRPMQAIKDGKYVLDAKWTNGQLTLKVSKVMPNKVWKDITCDLKSSWVKSALQHGSYIALYYEGRRIGLMTHTGPELARNSQSHLFRIVREPGATASFRVEHYC